MNVATPTMIPDGSADVITRRTKPGRARSLLGASDWMNAEYTLVDDSGAVRHYDYLLDTSFEEGQRVTLRLYDNELVFIDNAYAHQAWGGIEVMLFLGLPPSLVALLLLWASRPEKRRTINYRRGYVLLSIVASFAATMLFVGAMQLAWWPLPTLAIGVDIPALAFVVRHRRAS